MSLFEVGKTVVRAGLAGLGYRIQRIAPEDRLLALGCDPSVALPTGAEDVLRSDHPRLLELQRRYQVVDSPICNHTLWQSELSGDSMDLRYFRGESVYLWNYIKLGKRITPYDQMHLKYYMYARYVREMDDRGLLGRVLSEDGEFGCFAFRFQEMPTVSRDLLDSINEIYFLDRHWNLFGRSGVQVLDIGAGYGRLAHRMLTAAEGVARYWCIDAIPRSTFLCEYYLRHRSFLGDSDSRAVVVSLDEMESTVPAGVIDLAVNIHSFSEMSYLAVEAWLHWLKRLEVPWLLIVPNEPQMQSLESDGTRREYLGLIKQAGYRLVVKEPTLRDADMRRFFGVDDYFFLFQRDSES